MSRRKLTDKPFADPRLYTCPALPDRWVGTDAEGGLVHWPAVTGGWAMRTPYTGRVNGLRVVDPCEARGTGWSGSHGRRRLAGSERGDPMTVRLDATRRAALDELARKEGRTPSATARRSIDMALARGSTEP